MRIVVHVTKYYDWAPVPEGTLITEAALKSGKVKPAANGGQVMLVPIDRESHTTITLSERTIIETIVRAYIENGKCGTMLTRAEAVARHVGTVHMPQNAHPRWIKRIEVDDNGPSEELFREVIGEHVKAEHGYAAGSNIDAEDVEEMVKRYLEEKDAAGHVAHLHAHFRVAAPKVTK